VRVKPGIKWDQMAKYILQNEIETTLLQSNAVDEISKVFIASEDIVIQCASHSAAIAARFLLETNLPHITATGPGICLKMSLAVPKWALALSGPSLVDTLQEQNPAMPPNSIKFIKFQIEMFSTKAHQTIARTVAYIYVTPATYAYIEQRGWLLSSGFEDIVLVRAGGSS